MSILGSGAVAIWHNLLPEATTDFLQWHAREHMPERVAIPGFIRGRRYAVVGDGPAYFNLYEAETPEVLGGRDYLDRLNAPTPWTRRVVASFRDVARSTCAVRFSAGIGDGGWIATLTGDADADACARVIDALPSLAEAPGIAAAHVLVADEATSNLITAERAARADATAVPRHAVLIEGIDAAHCGAAADVVEALLPGFARAIFVLEHATTKR